MTNTTTEVVREKLLGFASNELATKQQELTERQQAGKNTKLATEQVAEALARVERLQEGVTYVEPVSEPEKAIASVAAQIILPMLDGEGAAVKYLPDLLKLVERLHAAIPEEDRKRFHIARQGEPFEETGRRDKTPTTLFDTGRTIAAPSHTEAIKTLIEKGDECGDPHGETPPIEDGEVLVVLGMKNRIVDPDRVWVEKIERPVFRGIAPHNNSKDPRFA